jgi:hypothetical protein
MGWFSVTDCVAAYRFGWVIGTVIGLMACLVITILIATTPAQRPDRPRAVNPTVRKVSQWILTLVPLTLVIAWFVSGHRTDEHLTCFALTASAGMIYFVAPTTLLLMFMFANYVGRASAR